MARTFDEVMIVNPFDPRTPNEGEKYMRFYRSPQPALGYYAAPAGYGYYAAPGYGHAVAPAPAEYGYYGETPGYGYYGEAPEYGYYAQPGYAAAPAGYYGYAEAPEVAGYYGYAEAPDDDGGEDSGEACAGRESGVGGRGSEQRCRRRLRQTG